MFINKETEKFYGGLTEQLEEMEMINHCLKESLKPMYLENKKVKSDNVALRTKNEDLKLDKIILSAVIDRIRKEFELPIENIKGIISDVENEYTDDLTEITEAIVGQEVAERMKIEKTYKGLKEGGYASKKAKSLELKNNPRL